MPLVLGLLWVDRLAFVLFVVGVGLTAGTVFADTFDVERMSPAMERLQQTLEEAGEGVAGVLLAAALTAHLIGRLAALAASEPQGRNVGD